MNKCAIENMLWLGKQMDPMLPNPIVRIELEHKSR